MVYQFILVSIVGNSSSINHYNNICHGLTNQEKKVLSLLIGNKSNAEIAHYLNIHWRTAATHARNILKKCDLNRIDELKISFSNLEINIIE